MIRTILIQLILQVVFDGFITVSFKVKVALQWIVGYSIFVRCVRLRYFCSE